MLLKSVSLESAVVPAINNPLVVVPTLKTGALSVRLLIAAYVLVAPLATEIVLVVLDEPKLLVPDTVTLYPLPGP